MMPVAVEAAVIRAQSLQAQLDAGGDPVAIHVQARAALAILAEYAGDDAKRRAEIGQALAEEQVELTWAQNVEEQVELAW